MTTPKLPLRLERVAAQVPHGAVLADIGSDHAYLPVALVSRGLASRVVAGEVASTPYQAAQRTVHNHDLGEKIQVRLADGLDCIEPGDGINAVALCGMGGETIRDILEAGKNRLGGHECLILQPNGGEAPLRHWLMDNSYCILHEEVFREKGFDYELIVARRSAPVKYSERELFFGPLLLKARSPAFITKWQRMLGLRRKLLMGFPHTRSGTTDEATARLSRQVLWIEEMLGNISGGSN
ncbi:tRNA (adenine(22)-N(1))-methyltransferase [Pseudomonas massiliensis]|uniref:tRNA (adenine(22)-N(1))-methyltransferase n=1 Tax=Pseudomonas massiliensis TaxID=522492 RepID=UPI00058B80EB|nr:tRNA (adenine(22)-N(1))-methyltransferase TrmK [Pseudomonas massiliensis]